MSDDVFSTCQITLSFAERDLDSEVSAELERQTGLVRRDLAELGLRALSVRSGLATPAGARGVDAEQVGQILTIVPPVVAVLRELVTALRSWARSGAQRTVRIEIDGDRLELSAATSEQQESLVTAWLERRR